MKFEENGERIKDLKLILSRVSYAASLFDDDGIQVRFMNSGAAGVNPAMLNGIRNEQQAEALVEQAKYSGLTPLGTELRNQIIEPLVLQRARSGQLRKPILIITITDGQPAGEPPKALEQTIAMTGQELSRMPQYGRHACKFQFAQVGNDQAATAFLAELDEKREFGDVVDCTSSNTSPFTRNIGRKQLTLLRLRKRARRDASRKPASGPNPRTLGALTTPLLPLLASSS